MLKRNIIRQGTCVLLVIAIMSGVLAGCKASTQRVSNDNVMLYGSEGSDSSLLVIKRGGRYGFCDTTGKIVIEPRFEMARPFHEGLAAVKDGYVYGYIDATGNFIISGNYCDVLDFHNGKALVGTSYEVFPGSYYDTMKIHYSIIDKERNLLGKTDYYYIGDYSEGVAPFLTEEGGFYVDFDYNKTIALPEYDTLSAIPAFHDGLACVQTFNDSGRQQCYYINKAGLKMFDSLFFQAKPFSGGFAAVKPDAESGMWGYIDTTGKQVIPSSLDKAYGFGEGMACVCDGSRWIVIDKAGSMICPIQTEIDEAGAFHEGLCAVCIFKERGGGSPSLKDCWGFIDASGKLVIGFKYDRVSPFINGIAQVLMNGKIGYIDKTGKYIWEPR